MVLNVIFTSYATNIGHIRQRQNISPYQSKITCLRNMHLVSDYGNFQSIVSKNMWHTQPKYILLEAAHE